MNNQLSETKKSYAWQLNKLPNPGDYPSAICLNQASQLFCATWNSVTEQGNLLRWSPSTSAWINQGGSFKSEINQMCTDKLGNIYMVGDQNTSGNYSIRIFNLISNQWSEADNGYKYPINYICCDSNNNVYITGNFVDANNHNIVAQYNVVTKKWTELTGSGFTFAITDMCIDANNTLYVLSSNTSPVYVSYWNGSSWNQINSANFQNASAIACDNSGNIYFNTTTSIMSYNISSQSFTDLNASIPTFSGTVSGVHLLHIDGILYYAISGFTGTTTMVSFINVYENGTWNDITCAPLNANNASSVLGLAGYTGKSHNILVASNLNYVLDGKQLIH